MSRYYGHVIIEFMDGSTARVGGNRASSDGLLLKVSTEGNYADVRDITQYPLVNIRSWKWESE